MQHRGEILEAAVRKSGIPLTRIVEKLGKSRKWIYNQFEISDVPLDILIDVGKVIHHDFSQEIDELNLTVLKKTLSAVDDANNTYEGNEVLFWKNKYLSLLEEFNEYLKKHS